MHEEHEEHGPVKQDPHDASSKKVESTIPPNPVNSTGTNIFIYTHFLLKLSQLHTKMKMSVALHEHRL